VVIKIGSERVFSSNEYVNAKAQYAADNVSPLNAGDVCARSRKFDSDYYAFITLFVPLRVQ